MKTLKSKFNKFYDEGDLMLHFIIQLIFGFLVFSTFIRFLIQPITDHNLSDAILFKFPFAISILFSLMMVLFVYSSRKVNMYYKLLEVITVKIKNAISKDELMI